MGMLTKRELVDSMGICDSTLWRWIKAGAFPPPSRKISNKKQWWDEEAVDRWFEEKQAKAAE